MAHDTGHPTVERRCDVAVIGGSAAGLAAALQLVRQRRSVLVVDDGTPRNAPAGHVHGYPGREGTPPAELLALARAEVRSYGGEVLAGRALSVQPVEPGGDGRFRVALTGGHRLLARRVLAATGIADELPDIPGLAPRWGRDVLSCPFCHGFEVRDRRLVQVVTNPVGLRQTPLLHHLTDRLTVVLHDAAGWADGIDAAVLDRLAAAGVPVLRDTVRRVLTGPDGALTGVELAGGELAGGELAGGGDPGGGAAGDGTVLDADAVFTGTQFHARAEALAPAGVRAAPHPSGIGDAVAADATGRTAAPGVYAAGNLTDPTMQVLTAAAHGSRVGAGIAVDLAGEDLAGGGRVSGEQADWDGRYGTGERMWSGNPNGTLVREAADLAPGRALDVGAGEGVDALWLAGRGWRVTATDISGAALDDLTGEAGRRGVAVACRRVDATDPGAFGSDTFDLVSLQYGSFHRSPDGTGLANLLGAVAPGGTLLVVGHDPAPLREPLDPAEQTRAFDPAAYVGVDDVAAAVAGDPGWRVEVHQTRPRPHGAVSTHHARDVVLRVRREPSPAVGTAAAAGPGARPRSRR